jgi:hypothetical protein
LPWNCRLLALELLLGRLSLSFPFILFPFRFSFFIPRSVVGTWGAPSVFLLFRPCRPGIRPFSAGTVLPCRCSVVPPAAVRRLSSAFLSAFLSAFVGVCRLSSASSVLFGPSVFSGRCSVLPGRCSAVPVGVRRLSSVLFGSAFRCYSARHFGVFWPGLGISARCSVFLLGFCCSFFKAGFLSVGFLPATVGIPPVFIPVSVGVYIGFLGPRILLAGILLFRWFCASRPVFRCSVCVLPPVFFRRLSSAFVVILPDFSRCLLFGSAFRCFLSGFVPRVFKAGRLSVGFPPRRCYYADVPSAFR